MSYLIRRDVLREEVHYAVVGSTERLSNYVSVLPPVMPKQRVRLKDKICE